MKWIYLWGGIINQVLEASCQARRGNINAARRIMLEV